VVEREEEDMSLVVEEAADSALKAVGHRMLLVGGRRRSSFAHYNARLCISFSLYSIIPLTSPVNPISEEKQSRFSEFSVNSLLTMVGRRSLAA
jgi:hypothetical protein